MFLHFATNEIDLKFDINNAVDYFKEKANIDLEGFEIKVFDITDMSKIENFNSELKYLLKSGRAIKKFVIIKFTSLEDISLYDKELYDLIKGNTFYIEIEQDITQFVK